jgi:hypothetical protein
MRPVIIASLAAAGLLASACSFKVTESQSITIDHYADDERNMRLAEDLLQYDRAYFMREMPALSDETFRGIDLVVFKSLLDGESSIQITYNTSIDAVADNLDELRSDFAAFIPVLAERHAANEPLFRELEPLAMSWVEGFFVHDPDRILEDGAQLLRDYVTPLQMARFQKNIVEADGRPVHIAYIRGQFYAAHDDVPDSISQIFELEMSSGRSYNFRVSLAEFEGEWLPIGFWVGPGSSSL